MTTIDIATYIEGIKNRDRRILSKAITLIESAHAGHRQKAQSLIDSILPYTGNSVRLGVTGIPGVGKSTFIESFGQYLVKSGYQVAVLAVDPSSKRSKGSVLGDKTRMQNLAVMPEAFIRPSPSGGTLGGVAFKTRETMLLCEAAGFDVIIVETVGVGQSETTVASMVDFFLVLMLAGAGDELQGIKKGIMEHADALAINKADGDNLKKAEKARAEFERAVHYFADSTSVWNPVVTTCSAVEGTGINGIWQTVLQHKKILSDSGELSIKRSKQSLNWLWTMLEEQLKARFYDSPGVKKRLRGIADNVEKGELSPGSAVMELLGLYERH